MCDVKAGIWSKQWLMNQLLQLWQKEQLFTGNALEKYRHSSHVASYILLEGKSKSRCSLSMCAYECVCMHTPGGGGAERNDPDTKWAEWWAMTQHKEIINFYVLMISAIGFELLIGSWIWKLKSIGKKGNGKPVLYSYQENTIRPEMY